MTRLKPRSEPCLRSPVPGSLHAQVMPSPGRHQQATEPRQHQAQNHSYSQLQTWQYSTVKFKRSSLQTHTQPRHTPDLCGPPWTHTQQRLHPLENKERCRKDWYARFVARSLSDATGPILA